MIFLHIPPTVADFYYAAIQSGLERRSARRWWNGCERLPDGACAIIDLQSAKATSSAEEREIDGGKTTKGRKWHIVADTMEKPADGVHSCRQSP